MTRHILSITDLASDEIGEVLRLATQPVLSPVLTGRGAALVFEHPSARTRNAAEMAVFSLGGHPVTIHGNEIGIDRRESAEDIARTLSGYHALIGARVARHSTLTRMARALDDLGRAVPVVNLLSEREHPSQALADLLTIEQCLGRLEGVVVAFVGDANNVARSLALGCALVGASFRIACPEGFCFAEDDVAVFKALGASFVQSQDPFEAADGADVLYSDVWVSMGEEADADDKRRAFEPFAINDQLVSVASPEAIVLHCLPAHRGEEIAASVIDGPRSRVWLQAENRMHALRGLLGLLFSERGR